MQQEKRKKVELSLSQKQEICRYAKENPSVKQLSIIRLFSSRFGQQLSKSTICTMLSKASEILSMGANCDRIRNRTAKYPQLEEALYMWFCDIRSINVLVNDSMIMHKAQYFGTMLQITDMKYSTGWLDKFKKRHGIEAKARAIDSAVIENQRVALREITNKYTLADIYNANEFSFFYTLLPDRTIVNTSEKETLNKNTHRISVMVCCNADGSDKQRLIVINKSKNNQFKSSLDTLNSSVDYYSNNTAWMTREIFKDWVQKFNNRIRQSNNQRHVLLLVDSSSGHLVETRNYSNVRVELFPFNMSRELQPCDTGIIESLKAQYRKQLIETLLYSLENYQHFHSPTIIESVSLLVSLWGNVTSCMIKNCWLKTKIVEKNKFFDNEDSIQTEAEKQRSDVLISINNILKRLEYYNFKPIEASTYVNMDEIEICNENLSDEDIILTVIKSSVQYEDEIETNKF